MLWSVPGLPHLVLWQTVHCSPNFSCLKKHSSGNTVRLHFPGSLAISCSPLTDGVWGKWYAARSGWPKKTIPHISNSPWSFPFSAVWDWEGLQDNVRNHVVRCRTYKAAGVWDQRAAWPSEMPILDFMWMRNFYYVYFVHFVSQFFFTILEY